MHARLSAAGDADESAARVSANTHANQLRFIDPHFATLCFDLLHEPRRAVNREVRQGPIRVDDLHRQLLGTLRCTSRLAC